MIKNYSNYLKESSNWFDDIDDEDELDPDYFISDPMFIKFLRERNILDEYCHNVENFPINEFTKDPKIAFSEINKMDYVRNSFNWAQSAQGHNFWSGIDIEWRRYESRNNALKKLSEHGYKNIPIPLRKFLAKEKCLKEYFINLYTDQLQRYGADYINFFKQFQPSGWFSYAFNWADSIEKYDFWGKINVKWVNELRENMKKDVEILKDDFIKDIQFKNFLIKNGALEKFITECLLKNAALVRAHIQSRRRENYIRMAFSWPASQDGRDYWEKLDKEWRAICKLKMPKMPLEFKEFLTKNRSHSRYVRNINVAGVDINSIKEPKKYIIDAFDFDKTPEGKKYWDRINDRWQEYLSKKTK